MAHHELNRVKPFTGTLYDLRGEHLASNVEGYLRRIAASPERYEGEFTVVNVDGTDSCIAATASWRQICLVTNSGTRLVLQCGTMRFVKQGPTVIEFTSDGQSSRPESGR